MEGVELWTGTSDARVILELRVEIRINDLEVQAWRGEVVGTTPDIAPGFKAGYVTVILLDDPLGRVAGAIATLTADKAMVFMGDDKFA